MISREVCGFMSIVSVSNFIFILFFFFWIGYRFARSVGKTEWPAVFNFAFLA